MTIPKMIFFVCLCLVACNHIETGNDLRKADIRRIQELGLLDKDETIYKFYSEFKNKVAGNFFTNKRIAKYWIDENNKLKDNISFAFYRDIISIDTIYDAGVTYCPYLLVTKTDHAQFKVSVEGSKEEIKSFFEEAITIWNKNKKF
jgi:hypothetical protein